MSEGGENHSSFVLSFVYPQCPYSSLPPQTLPLALASRVGPGAVRLGSTVVGLSCDPHHQPRPVWTLHCTPSSSPSSPPPSPSASAAGPGADSERGSEPQRESLGDVGGSEGKGEQKRRGKMETLRFDAVVVTVSLTSAYCVLCRQRV